jgi:hypothetical protein
MPRPVRSERDKIAAKARRLCADPAVAAEWRRAWVRVLDRLAPVYEARGLAVHHSNETAREAMLRALVAGRPAAECEEIAFWKIYDGDCNYSLTYTVGTVWWRYRNGETAMTIQSLDRRFAKELAWACSEKSSAKRASTLTKFLAEMDANNESTAEFPMRPVRR